MKHISFVFILIFLNISLYSQPPFHSPTVTVGGVTYDCNMDGRIRVVNQNNTVSDGNYTDNYDCVYANDKLPNDYYDSIKLGVKNTLGISRWNEMISFKENITLYLYFNTDGSMKEVWFYLRNNTQITPQELLDIENSIKSHTFVLNNASCIGVVPFHATNFVLRFE